MNDLKPTLDMKRLYNSDLKAEYFDTQFTNINTKTTTYFDFLAVAEIENDLDKDAYAFNDLEIADVLRSYESSTVLGVQRLLSSLNDYLKWCINNGKRGNDETRRNNVENFIKNEVDLNKYVSTKQIEGKILDENQFNDLLNVLVNPIDSALILCMYNFIGGKDFNEIRNLTIDSIDVENNTLLLVDTDKEGREISRVQKVSERLIDELLLLKKVPTYLCNNGMEDKIGRIREMPFVPSKYLFRSTQNTKHYRGKDELISVSTLYTRIRQIKQDTGYNYINPTSLRDTRLVHEVLKEARLKGEKNITQEIIHNTIAKVKEEYGIPFSLMQTYSLEQKIKKLIEIGKLL